MKKQLFIIITFILFTVNAYSQIEKGNWMIGGSANFSSANSSNNTGANNTQTNWQVSANVGYFILNKFAVGLKPGYSDEIISQPGSGINGATYRSNISTFSIGPFIRYYFLDAKNRVNIFSEIDYQYNASKAASGEHYSFDTYSILAGPVIYLNSSVGMELSVGYSRTILNTTGVNSRTNTVQVGIGFQIHLGTKKSS